MSSSDDVVHIHRPQMAFRLDDYRLFCRSCDGVCDVRAIHEEDAEREARKIGWSVTDLGATCPLCLDHLRRAARPTTQASTQEIL